MKNLRRNYESSHKTENDYLDPWIDHFQIINDENDKLMYSLWGVAINCPDELDGFGEIKAFTFLEAVLFNTVIILNVLRQKKPKEFEIIQERYFEKLYDAIELHFLDSFVNIEGYIRDRLLFYYQQIIELQKNNLPSKIFSAFYDDDFYLDTRFIPNHTDRDKVEKFNKYLNQMFETANLKSVNVLS